MVLWWKRRQYFIRGSHSINITKFEVMDRNDICGLILLCCYKSATCSFLPKYYKSQTVLLPSIQICPQLVPSCIFIIQRNHSISTCILPLAVSEEPFFCWHWYLAWMLLDVKVTLKPWFHMVIRELMAHFTKVKSNNTSVPANLIALFCQPKFFL